MRATKKHIRAALKFNERRQGDDESFDSFVTDLKILVKDCDNQEEEPWFETRSFFVVNIPKYVRNAWVKQTRWHVKGPSKSVEITKQTSAV